MILDVFPSYKDKETVDLLYQFERATGLSLNILVEKYLERMLYKEGYLTVNNIDEKESVSIDSKNLKFKKKKWGKGKKCQITFEDLSFSSFDSDMADDIIDKLSLLDEDKLKELSVNNWDYPKKHYCGFLLSKLENIDLTPEEYLESQPLFTIETYSDSYTTYSRFMFKRQMIATFSHKKHSKEVIEKAESFLTKQDVNTLQLLVDKRIKLKERSDEFLLRHIDNPKLIYEGGK